MELLIEAERPGDANSLERERTVRRHAGDYALFMSGIFRNYIERNGYLNWYLVEGARSYRRTAQIERRLSESGAGLFEVLSEEFERLSGGLDYMRKVYFGRAAVQSGLDVLLRRFDTWN